jgi:hypothetical protein
MGRATVSHTLPHTLSPPHTHPLTLSLTPSRSVAVALPDAGQLHRRRRGGLQPAHLCRETLRHLLPVVLPNPFTSGHSYSNFREFGHVPARFFARNEVGRVILVPIVTARHVNRVLQHSGLVTYLTGAPLPDDSSPSSSSGPTPKPETWNPRLQTPDPKPQTPNPKP